MPPVHVRVSCSRARELASVVLAGAVAVAALARAPDAGATQAAGSAAGCAAEPLPGVTLYLRGSMNSWAPDEEYAFRWRCDAYVLNVDLKSRHEFKVADADWSPATTFGDDGSGGLVVGGSNAAHGFAGPHTLQLRVRGPRARLEVGP